MRVKLSIELDLTDTHYNVETKESLPACLMNLSDWIDKLNWHYQDLVIATMCRDDLTPLMKKAMLQAYETDQKLSKQIFDHFSIVGETEDGHKFESYKTKGQNAILIIDGVDTWAKV